MYIVFYICFLVLLNSCATIVPPSGGEKDTSPPEILSTSPLIGQLILKKIKFKLTLMNIFRLTNQILSFFHQLTQRHQLK